LVAETVLRHLSLHSSSSATARGLRRRTH
jgi:hypothetical protein